MRTNSSVGSKMPASKQLAGQQEIRKKRKWTKQKQPRNENEGGL